VIVPTHNPAPGLLPGLLAALATQTLSAEKWEIIVVDNASNPPVTTDWSALEQRNISCRLIREPRAGLTFARLAGFAAARNPWIVMLDDDNRPRDDYLEKAVEFAALHPHLGAFGGKSLPVFAEPPPKWFAETGISLGCRDKGDDILIAESPPLPRRYPDLAPIGAGMVLRKEVAVAYAKHVSGHPDAATDRRGKQLSSGGDCEIVLLSLFDKFGVAYTPTLVLDHLIPASRLKPDYLARLNRESSRSWVSILDRFDINTWPRISPVTVPLRKLRAWWRHRAWKGPKEHIAWAGACGLFEGQARLSRRPRSTE